MEYRIFILTHNKTSYDENNARNYELEVFTEKPKAVAKLKQNFAKSLGKTKLNEERKKEQEEKFNKNLLEGKFYYHFRDTQDPNEPQIFGKIHTRTLKF